MISYIFLCYWSNYLCLAKAQLLGRLSCVELKLAEYEESHEDVQYIVPKTNVWLT